MQIIAMPANPENPISRHNKIPIKRVIVGPIHMPCKSIVTHSNRLTSFDSRFTTLPGDVSPSAVCDKRKAYL